MNEPSAADRLREAAAVFEELRPRLVGVAYGLLGMITDAEDVVQEAWIRLQSADPDTIEDLTGWLVTAVSRLALDVMRSARVRREAYAGPWLPEPVETMPDPADAVSLADSLSWAMLVVLETLSPAERAAFVLHDVFGLPFDQVARALGRAPAACRKLASRARRHIQERQPRFEVDAESHREVVAAFCAAAQSGDIEALLQVLDPDAVMTTDGGGVVRALPAPLRGAREIAEFLANGARLAPGRQFQVTAVNGQPALLMGQAGRLFTVIALGIRNGRIATIDAVVNPHKFHGLQHTAQPGDSRGNTPWKPDSTS